MSEKTDGNWSFLSDDENDDFEEVPFEETPFDTAVPTAPPITEPSEADNTAPEEPREENPVEDKAQTGSQEAEEVSEETKKWAAHDAAEAQRKAEFDARQAAKKQAEEEQIAKTRAMSDEEVTAAAIQRAGADTEKLTRRNMKEMVTEFVQTLCIEDPAFARLTMHPRKSMLHCFQYINRKAFEYVQDEMKASGITPGPRMQTYGADVPDDVCYQWAEDYFRDPTVKEDQEEEKFIPKAYAGKTAASSKSKKAPAKKKDEKKSGTAKSAEKPVNPSKDEQAAVNGQISMFGGL